ncbi:glycosyltransferase family 2 protein [Salinicola sp. V024]|uniref:glycosyltransferase family 2 protein n=1 Tax=Salinicola sp. V024 TaxID=3459609 RepID=UPI0040439B9C
MNKTDYYAVKKSKLINSAWYLQQYPDVSMAGIDPVRHYMKYGWRMKRNPCRRFDSELYLSDNPEVASSGQNPLLHYIYHGRKEGRRTSLEYLNDFERDLEKRLNEHLWGAYPSHASRDLQNIVDLEFYAASLRARAAWSLARWEFFNANYERSLYLVKISEELDTSSASSKKHTILKSFCYLNLGKDAAAAQEIKRYEQKYGYDSDLGLVYANTLNGDLVRLEAINKCFVSNGLSPISLLDPKKGLNFENLTSMVLGSGFDCGKVTVILPVFNCENNIDVALSGLASQTYKNIEVIVIDDKSDDNTYQKALKWAELDSRFNVFKVDENGGAYKARNVGLKYMTGDYFTTHDGDDWSHPQKLELQIRFLEENPDVEAVMLHWVRALEGLYFTPNWRPGKEIIHWSHSSFLARRRVFETLGGWDNVQVGGDTEYIWRVQAKYGKLSVRKIHPGMPLSFAMDDAGSLTRNKVTHVKSIHFGLRHIYREICRWRHKKSSMSPVSGHVEHFASGFPSPNRMFSRDPIMLSFDELYVSDFSDKKLSQPVFDAISQLDRDEVSRVAFLHLPKYETVPGRLLDSYFSALESGVVPVVLGEYINAEKVMVASNLMEGGASELRSSISSFGRCYYFGDDSFEEYAVHT